MQLFNLLGRPGKPGQVESDDPRAAPALRAERIIAHLPKPRCETLQCAAAFCSARVQARTLHGAPSSCSARAPRAGEPLKPLCVLTRLQLLPSRAHHMRTGLSGAPDLPTALCSHPTPFALS